MNINIALTLGGVVAILVGVILGYLLRLFISMSNRGSLENEVKKLLLSAKEDAQMILIQADQKSAAREEELREEEKKYDHEFKKTDSDLSFFDPLIGCSASARRFGPVNQRKFGGCQLPGSRVCSAHLKNIWVWFKPGMV